MIALGSSGAALPFPAPRRPGELAGSRLPPLGNLLLQVQDLGFYIGEPIIVILDKVFELLVRRDHS